MRHFVVALTLLAALPFGALRADEPQSGKPAAKNQADAVEALPAGEYVGRLVAVKVDASTLVLQLTKQRQVLKNPNGPTQTADQIANAIDEDVAKVGRMYTDSAISRSPQEYERKRQETQKAVTKFQLGLQPRLDKLDQQLFNPKPVEFITVTDSKDVKLAVAAAAKVRLREVPTIDDEGNVHTSFTPEELRKLKGKEPFAPGYDGKLRHLTAGDYVRVTVAPAAASRDGDKKIETARPGSNATEITAIAVITKEQAEKAQTPRP